MTEENNECSECAKLDEEGVCDDCWNNTITQILKFGEGASFTENRIWDFVTGKTNKPPELAFTSGKSRDIAREFERLKIKIAELETEKQKLISTIKTKIKDYQCDDTCINNPVSCAQEKRIIRVLSEIIRGEK